MKNNFELRIYSSLEKIFPHSAPKAQNEILRLSAMGNERVSFQISYKPAENSYRSWGRLNVNAPDGMRINLRRVRYIPGSFPQNYKKDNNYLTTETGLFPDLLEPFNAAQLPLIPGIWQTVWVDVIAEPEAAEGYVYINIANENGDVIAAANVNIVIIPAELPPLHIPHTRWFHTDCLAQYYGVEVFSEEYWQIVEYFAEYAVSHGINTLLTPIFTPPLDTAIDGERLTVQLIDVICENGNGYKFDFTKFERWVEMCKRAGVEYYEISHLFTQWGAKHAPKIVAQDGMRLFGWETDATGAEYTNFLQQMLPALTAKLFELGIGEKTIFHISDEPGLDSLEQYTAARKIVEPYLAGFKIADALTNFDFYKHGVVSVPIPSVDHIEPFLEGNVPELWCYYCCAQSYDVPNLFFAQPSYRNRILGVLLYKYNIAGFLQWGYNFYNSMHSLYPINPFVVTDADGAFPSGDPFIVYPDPGGKPMASVRLMAAQEAFYDLRALCLLEQLAGRNFVLNLIDDGLAEPITFKHYPQSADYILDLRQRVNYEIAKRHLNAY